MKFGHVGSGYIHVLQPMLSQINCIPITRGPELRCKLFKSTLAEFDLRRNLCLVMWCGPTKRVAREKKSKHWSSCDDKNGVIKPASLVYRWGCIQTGGPNEKSSSACDKDTLFDICYFSTPNWLANCVLIFMSEISVGPAWSDSIDTDGKYVMVKAASYCCRSRFFM